jgi:serine/threonine-protein kinase
VVPVVPTAPVGTKAGPGEVFDAEPVDGPKSKSKSKTKGAKTAAGGAVAIRPGKSRKKLYWSIGIVVLVLVLAAGALVAINKKVFTPSHPVPVLVPLTLAQARAAAAKDHFTLHLEKGITSISVPAGSVISQSPKVGTSLKEGSKLSVVPSIGPPPVAVPSLTGMTCAAAAATLATAHLKATCAAGQYSSTVAAGTLLSWAYGTTPNPTSAPYGSTITLTPSAGHAPVSVPPLPAGYTYAQAAAAIGAVGLVAAEQTQTSTSVSAGTIISSSPASGAAAPYGSTVTVVVSSGPPTTAVPNVLGQSVTQATTELQADGFVVSGVTGNPKNPVNGTVPATGAVVPTGSSVQILA